MFQYGVAPTDSNTSYAQTMKMLQQMQMQKQQQKQGGMSQLLPYLQQLAGGQGTATPPALTGSASSQFNGMLGGL